MYVILYRVIRGDPFHVVEPQMNCSNRPCGYMCKEHNSYKGQQGQSPQGLGVLGKGPEWLEQRRMVGEVAR